MFAGKICQFFSGSTIATKISCIYAAFFVILMVVMNFVAWYGTFYALYAPATNTINFSMKNVINYLSVSENPVDADSMRNLLVTGVVLRIVKDNGEILVDTDSNYPSLKMVNENILESQPFFAEKNMSVSKLKNALVYCAPMDYEIKGEYCKIYFLRTITSKTDIFERIEWLTFGVNLLGIICAFAVGRYINRKFLRPIKTITRHAKNIAFGEMDGRIKIPTARDELTELAETFNKMLDRLQVGINRQQKFVSNVSHELRTPATVISGYIEFLKTYGDGDKALLDESLEAIRSESDNMYTLLENLLFLSRADQQTQKVKKKTLNLDEIVSDVMKKMTTVVKSHEVKLNRNDAAQIFGDETMIRQMLRIFLDNALKYTPKDGKISVESIRKGDKILLSVADSGIGIAPENQEKIFDRFFRVDTELLVEESKGSGLGLSIAKWIAVNHGIDISLKSELGVGTTFTLAIPVTH